MIVKEEANAVLGSAQQGDLCKLQATSNRHAFRALRQPHAIGGAAISSGDKRLLHELLIIVILCRKHYGPFFVPVPVSRLRLRCGPP